MAIANLTLPELLLLEGARTEAEWEACCDIVKEARGGQYPPDWFQVMNLSGRMDRIFKRFGTKRQGAKP